MESQTDKQRVIEYLQRLMQGTYFSQEDLDALSVEDLQHDTPIQDIDRSILEKTLQTFKDDFVADIFEDVDL